MRPARISHPPPQKPGADSTAEIFITVSISHALFAPYLSDGETEKRGTDTEAESRGGG